MSTKTSSDIHVNRSSTRRHAPPGGKSSISFGWEEKATAAVQVAEDMPEETVEVDEIHLETIEVTEYKIGLVVVDGPACDVLVSVLSKALARVGIVSVSVGTVKFRNMLPQATRKMTSACHGVIALDIIEKDAIGCGHGSTAAVLMSALYEVGTVTDVPVIPGIICQSSLLEAKGVLPNLAEEWSCAMLDMLDLANIEDGEFGAVHAPEAAPFAPPTPEEADYATLLEKFRETLKARGASGIFGLQRKFRIMDDDNSKSISMAEFSKAVKEHTLEWTPAQVKILFDHFDSDQSGGISFDEFIFGVRGVLNERRQQLVMMAFEILDTDKSGVIEVDDVKAKYDTSKHPDVISGKRTSDDVLRVHVRLQFIIDKFIPRSEFLETFEGTENDAKDGKVTPAEFMRYYANLSSSIDEDDYFELMIRNAWHISGGEGWCENSTCRRVLVVHQDGRQTVEEISNDLGMDKDDKDAMIARLVEQGIDDIASIDLSGSCDTPSTPAAAEAPAAVVQARTGRRAQGGKATIVLG